MREGGLWGSAEDGRAGGGRETNSDAGDALANALYHTAACTRPSARRLTRGRRGAPAAGRARGARPRAAATAHARTHAVCGRGRGARGTFVAQDGGKQALGVAAAQGVRVRVAQSARGQLHPHLPRLWRVHLRTGWREGGNRSRTAAVRKRAEGGGTASVWGGCVPGSAPPRVSPLARTPPPPCT